ncbi:hypothetical protein Cni_G27313 [Canna indica]|uniref:Uncharacterized protein n=1 Tax=Canna indica TaxID=4628 RepID=A0AAQ3QMV1_9LILI|nr:hypothetical protein Cni_G27313 [Canna indica]
MAMAIAMSDYLFVPAKPFHDSIFLSPREPIFSGRFTTIGEGEGLPPSDPASSRSRMLSRS